MTHCRIIDNFQEQYSKKNNKAKGGSVMRTHDGYDAGDSYEREEDTMGENVRNGNDEIESNGRRFQGHCSKLQPPREAWLKPRKSSIS